MIVRRVKNVDHDDTGGVAGLHMSPLAGGRGHRTEDPTYL